MKRILFSLNHFDYSNGVAMALKNIISNINIDKYELSVNAIYRFDLSFAKDVLSRIKIVPGYNRYFRGLDKIINQIPAGLLYKRFIKDNYDLEVSFQYGIPTKMLSWSRTPKICWMHTYDTGLCLLKYYKKFDKVITVSKIGRDRLINDGFDGKRVDYCYNIIDEDIIELKKGENTIIPQNNKTIVITVARLDKDKAYMRYFRCINAVRNKLTNLQFWIVGGGSEEELLRDYIKTNDLQDLIIMFGAQTNPYPYISKANIYFCCSYREGFSTTCQEASTIGIPVVSVNVDGAKELMDLSECGKVINNDEESIKSALIDIANNDTWKSWIDIAKNNKHVFYKHNRIAKIESVFDSVIES